MLLYMIDDKLTKPLPDVLLRNLDEWFRVELTCTWGAFTH